MPRDIDSRGGGWGLPLTALLPGGAALHLALEVEVSAPIDRVWSILASVEGWPRWHAGIAFAALRGGLEPGALLQWRADGMPMRSVLLEVDAPHSLIWTSRTLAARGVHRWSLIPVSEGMTLVRSEEAWDGLSVRILRSTLTRTLTHSREHWLAQLRDRSETDPSVSGGLSL